MQGFIDGRRTIFAGTDAYEKLKEHLGIVVKCSEIKMSQYKILMAEGIDPASLITTDPDIKAVMEELEKQAN